RSTPAWPDAWIAFGEAAMASGREEDGLAALNHALTLDPRSTGAYAALGEYYLRQQSAQGAVDQFRRYTAIRPDDPVGWRGLARAGAGRPGQPPAGRRRMAARRLTGSLRPSRPARPRPGPGTPGPRVRSRAAPGSVRAAEAPAGS